MSVEIFSISWAKHRYSSFADDFAPLLCSDFAASSQRQNPKFWFKYETDRDSSPRHSLPNASLKDESCRTPRFSAILSISVEQLCAIRFAIQTLGKL